jgi:nicotinate phosphoribosyltransferase
MQVLGIALTDTFGTPAFLDAFRKPIREAPVQSDASANPPVTTDVHVDNSHSSKTYAQVYTGVRQDSGDPTYFVKMVREFYDREGITDKKTVVFSDSLNIENCLEYKAIAEEANFNPTFGVGTFFTSKCSLPAVYYMVHSMPNQTLSKKIADDFTNKSNGQKSKPLNIVIKIATANGRPAVKLSDNMGKNTGDSAKVQEVKQKLGYTEQSWVDGNESNRWAGRRS